MPNDEIRRDQWPTDPFFTGDGGAATRRAWLQLAGSIGALGVLAALLPAPWAWSRAAGSTPRTTDVVQAAALVAGSGLVWVLLGWSVLVAAVAGLAHLPGVVGEQCRRFLRRVVPVAARRVLVTAVGVSLAGGLASGLAAGTAAAAVPASTPVAQAMTTASAIGGVSPTPDSSDRTGSGQPPSAGVAQPLRSPGLAFVVAGPDGGKGGKGSETAGSALINLDWPGHPAPAPAPTPNATTPTGLREVVVLRGDTLWGIAARHLPAGATDVQIDAAWHRWYQANRQVIGDNPNLILPGQRLLPPPAAPDQP